MGTNLIFFIFTFFHNRVLGLQVSFSIKMHRFAILLMDWLHQAQIARQNRTRQSQMKQLLVLSGFVDQKFAGNLKEVGQIVPNSA